MDLFLPVVFWKMLISPEVNVIINSIPEFGLISSTTSGAEKHFQPVLFKVIVKVSPSRLYLLEPFIICIDGITSVQPVKCIF